MCDSSSKKQKWICDYCTYENFPSAIKCTMCKGVKPMVNEDIFRLSPPQISYETDGEARGAVAEVIDSEPISFNACSRRDSHNTVEAEDGNILDNSGKWSCKMCTYLNWPRSVRCVQCYTKRGGVTSDTSPSREIGATSVAAFKSTSLQHPPPPPSSQSILARCDLEHDGPQALQHKRSRDIIDTKSIIDCGGMVGGPAEASSNQMQHHHRVQERLSKMHIASNIDAEMNASNSAASAAAAAAGAAAQRLSPVEGSNTHLNNLANSSQTQTSTSSTCLSSTSTSTTNPQLPTHISKWACNTCTYENFPKSLKCSMCGNPRDSNSSSATANSIENVNVSGAGGGGGGVVGSIGSAGIDGSSNNQTNITCSSDKMNDTVSSNNSFNKQQHIYQLGSDTINNCDTMQERQERRIRQIRRQVDWQWLNACLGVVENNYSAVEAYLSCGSITVP